MKLDQEHSETDFEQKTPYVENVDDQLIYESFYSYPINNGMTINPLFYVKEVNGFDNETALMVK